VQPGLELAGRYILEEMLGSGGMGDVWRGADRRLGRPVAVKVMHDWPTRSGLDRRFEREARIGARLQHPEPSRWTGDLWRDPFYRGLRPCPEMRRSSPRSGTEAGDISPVLAALEHATGDFTALGKNPLLEGFGHVNTP